MLAMYNGCYTYDVFDGDDIAACWILREDLLITSWTTARKTGYRMMKSKAIPTQVPMIEVIINHLRLYRGSLCEAEGGAAASSSSGCSFASAGWPSCSGTSGFVRTLIRIPAGIVLAKGSANGSDSGCPLAVPVPPPANEAAWPVGRRKWVQIQSELEKLRYLLMTRLTNHRDYYCKSSPHKGHCPCSVKEAAPSCEGSREDEDRKTLT